MTGSLRETHDRYIQNSRENDKEILFSLNFSGTCTIKIVTWGQNMVSFLLSTIKRNLQKFPDNILLFYLFEHKIFNS